MTVPVFESMMVVSCGADFDASLISFYLHRDVLDLPCAVHCLHDGEVRPRGSQRTRKVIARRRKDFITSC